MAEDLPSFKYHPDPLDTGSVVASDDQCVCCGRARGFIYHGPVYAIQELVDEICPWCIADGSAHVRFDAEFTDAAMIGQVSPEDEVLNSVVEEIAYRTPGFAGWQIEMWFAHHGDGAAFLGPAGRHELQERWPDALPSIRSACDFLTDEDWPGFFASLDIEHGPTAYVFRCLHCGQYGGYVDFA